MFARAALLSTVLAIGASTSGRAQGVPVSTDDREALGDIGRSLPEHGLSQLLPPAPDSSAADWQTYAKGLVEALVSPDKAEQFDASVRPLGEAVRSFIPTHPAYERLRTYLKELATALRSDRPVIRKVRYKIASGTVSPEVATLRRRLRLEGYGRTASAPARPNYFDRGLRIALNHWQRDNGLGQTRHVDNLTRWRLNRFDVLVGRVALGLRRWRQHALGDGLGQFVLVDLNRGVLGAWRDGNEELRFAVIAGKPNALDATPAFSSHMDRIVVNPAWRVPRRIAEVFQRDAGNNPQQLRKRGFKVTVDGTRWSVAQPPGPTNPLGHFIFRMPKTRGIFLHDTHRKGLFNSPKRHLSHGCVRLERALELARWILPESEHPTLDRLVANGQTKHYVLQNTVATHVVYMTMDVSQDGKVIRMPDPYRRDASELPESMRHVPAILAYKSSSAPPPSASEATSPGAATPAQQGKPSEPVTASHPAPRYGIDASVRPLPGGAAWPLERFRGRIAILTFLASWCDNCHKLAPSLKRVVDGFRARGIDIALLGIGLDEAPAIDAYVKRWNLPYPVVVGGPRLRNGATALGRIDRLPMTWVVGRTGVPLYSYEGRNSAKMLAADVERYLQAERSLAK